MWLFMYRGDEVDDEGKIVILHSLNENIKNWTKHALSWFKFVICEAVLKGFNYQVMQSRWKHFVY